MRREKIILSPKTSGYVHLGKGNLQMKSPHIHDELELNLVLQGHACYLVKGRRYDLRPRSLVWLFPGQNHTLLDCSADFTMWIVVFHQRLVKQVHGDKRYAILEEKDPGLDWTRRLSQKEAERLDSLMAELSQAEKESHLLLNAGLRYLLLTALKAFNKSESVPSRAEVHPAVEKAAHILETESDIVSEDRLAERVGLSRSRLSRLFQSQTGVPLVQFRNRQRMSRFLHIYGTGQQITMLDAALEAGFGSYAQFHRVFKLFMGRSPADHRRTISV